MSDVSRLSESFVTHSGVEEWIAGGRSETLARVAARARRTRGLSDAWAHLLVAQGSVEVLLEHEPCQSWDWAATGLIVEEAGGRLSTLAGDRPVAGGDLLVTNGSVHREMVEVLAAGTTMDEGVGFGRSA